jgi:membrane protease YdiL (CAAX protease family)
MQGLRAARASLVLLLAATCGFATCRLTPASDGSPADRLAIQSLGLEIFLAGVALAAAAGTPNGLHARLGLGPLRIRVGSCALLVLGTLALSHGIDGLLELTRLREQSPLAGMDLALAGARGSELVLALVGIGLAPGIAEELLFRGLVQRGLARHLGPAAAICLAAVLFGAFHGPPVYAASTAVLGLYLGIAAHLAGGVRAAIACHTANNLLAVAVAARWPGLAPEGAASALLGFAAAFACLWCVARRAPAAGLEGSRDGGGAPPAAAAL